MKPNRRRPPSQANPVSPPSPDLKDSTKRFVVELVMADSPTPTRAPDGGLDWFGDVIRGSKDPIGGWKRRRGKIQFAQAALLKLFGGPPPADYCALAVTRDINQRLAENPEYRAIGFGKISPRTVVRAIEKLRDANR